MSYIPPHLRVSKGQSKPRPEPPSPPSRGPNVHARNSKDLLPDVSIVKSSDFVSRVNILSCRDVQFAKYEEDTFAHLQHHRLYVLEPAFTGEDANELSLQAPPERLIVEAVEEELKGVLEKFKELACVDGVRRLVPLLWLKFGKLLFRSRNHSFEWHKVFAPQEVLAMTAVEKGLSKTFENSVSKEKFSILHDFAHKNALQSWSKERFTVQVSDESRPDTFLWCVCACSKGDEQTRLVSKTSALTMLKVRLSPVRYMISDVACVGKSSDIRLMFFLKEYVMELSDAEVKDLESCLGKACVDNTVKGGLRWPLGSKQSASKRFNVVGSAHVTKTVVMDAGLRWSLQKCNRVEFKASSGRISYEVGFRPLVYNEFCKGRGEWTIEDVLRSIADALQQVWEGCIES